MQKNIIFAFLIISVFLPEKAYAYLDPGTGSMVLQIILASIIGVGITFKSWIYKIKSMFVKKK